MCPSRPPKSLPIQFSEEELQAEFESAVAEFKKFNQEYDEKRVREQVSVEALRTPS